MTRIEQLRDLYEECGEAETAGRIAALSGEHSSDNPHWEARVPAMFQPMSALEWREGFQSEFEAEAIRRSASTIPEIQQRNAA